MLLRSLIAALMWVSLAAIALPIEGEAAGSPGERREIQLAGEPVAVIAPSPAPAAVPPAEAEPALSLEDRREIQQALITLGHLQGAPDGSFGSLTPAAIKQFQSFQGDAETGTLSQDERYKLLNMARRLLQLLQPASASPKE
jgi:peptidoglycan hydrolase-like protein with peptidoglycan-binding domain